MSIPAVRAIKSGRPDAHITVAAPEKIAPVWKLVAEVDEVIPIPQKSLLATSRILKRQNSFDAVVLFPNSLRAALEVWLARIPRRAGFRGHHRSWLLNQIIPEREKPGPVEHHAIRYLRIAKAIGAQIDDRMDVLPHVQLSADEKPRVSNNGVAKIGLCPGAEYGPAKRWLPERFIETAQSVSQNQNVHWIIFGTRKTPPSARRSRKRSAKSAPTAPAKLQSKN